MHLDVRHNARAELVGLWELHTEGTAAVQQLVTDTKDLRQQTG